MKLEYKLKSEASEVLSSKNVKNIIGDISLFNSKNDINRLLFQGDNLEVMKSLITQYGLKETVDLVYIDIPFSTNTIFRIEDSRVSTISSSKSDRIAYTDTLKGSEFLEFIRQRLILIRELMSNKASIYLHIDYKIGHYIKVIMDEVFGLENFRNDITRIKCNPKNFQRKGYSNIKDLILFYTKTDEFTWNEPMEGRSVEELNKLFNKVDVDGRHYTTNPLHAPGETTNGKTGQEWNGVKPPKGRHWRYGPDVLDDLEKRGLIEWSKNGVPRKKIFIEDFQTKRVQDIWEFKDKPHPIYPTEKNLELLERIINASSNPKDLVMDCFCGSGGLLFVAEKLGRRWIGMDESEEAINVSVRRFRDASEDFNNPVISKFRL